MIVMKRTTAGIVHADLAKLHKITYDINDIRRIKNPVYYPSFNFWHKSIISGCKCNQKTLQNKILMRIIGAENP